MKGTSISDLFQFQKRFLRSANLERDFKDSTALNGYVLTPQIINYAQAINTGLKPDSGKRAWKINGNFGSGKSSFALFLANLFSNKSSEIPSQLSKATQFNNFDVKKPDLLPILITGSREPLSTVLCRTLVSELKKTG